MHVLSNYLNSLTAKIQSSFVSYPAVILFICFLSVGYVHNMSRVLDRDHFAIITHSEQRGL